MKCAKTGPGQRKQQQTVQHRSSAGRVGRQGEEHKGERG